MREKVSWANASPQSKAFDRKRKKLLTLAVERISGGGKKKD